MTCRCHTPILYSDPRHEAWCACGHHPREDLGEDRTADERLRYRMLLNRLRRSNQPPTVDEVTAKRDAAATRKQALTERAQMRRFGGITRVCPVCEQQFVPRSPNHKRCSAECAREFNRVTCQHYSMKDVAA